jgi:hypothetical protein
MPCKYFLSIGSQVTLSWVELGEVTFTCGALLGTENENEAIIYFYVKGYDHIHTFEQLLHGMVPGC